VHNNWFQIPVMRGLKQQGLKMTNSIQFNFNTTNLLIFKGGIFLSPSVVSDWYTILGMI